MSEDLILKLREKFSKHNVTVIIGTGISIYTSNNNKNASWKGLLQSGINYCRSISPKLKDEWFTERYKDLESCDANRLIICANEIVGIMGGNNSQEFKKWIENTVGSIKVVKSEIIEALYDLDALFLTTNYDGLFSEVTGLRQITWIDSYEMDKVVRCEKSGIIHLHGFWKEPSSIVFDATKYEEILKKEYTQAAMRAIYGTKTFLFIGFGAGLEDPNFANLFNWIKKVYKDTEFQIFRLVREEDLQIVETNDLIKNISYGDRYEDLFGFLWELAPKRIYQPAAHKLRLLIRSLSKNKLTKVQNYKIEWLISAALDNGCFEPGKKKDYIDPRRRSDEEIWEAFNALNVEKIVQKKNDNKDIADEYFLGDIDDYVLPNIANSLGVQDISSNYIIKIRGYLKELAQKKASKKMWDIKADGYLPPKKIDGTVGLLEGQTINLIKNTKSLKVISEYGTWMRSDPFRDHIRTFINKLGEIQLIISEPPPYKSEGYNEWCDSVYILLDWGVKIWICDRKEHKLHMNIGHGEIIYLEREATEIKLKKGYSDDPENVAWLESEFDKYMNSKYVISLENWIKQNPLRVKGDNFEILTLGEWTNKSIEANWSNFETMSTNKKIADFIEGNWTKETKYSQSNNQILFSENLTRLDSFMQNPDKLILQLSPTNYKEYIGTNKYIEIVKEIVGNTYFEYLSNPLTVSVVLKTRDNKIVVAHRSKSTFEYPEYLHVPGGHIQSDKHRKEGKIEVFDAILDEIREEFQIEKSDLKDLKCLGLCRDRKTLKPELTFYGDLNLILSNIKINPENKEHINIIGVDNSKTQLFDFLIQNRKNIVPVGKACLVIYGKYKYGSEWFVSVIDKLRSLYL